MSVTEEMLAAYADGELDAADLAAVEAAIAAAPALARKVQAHRALKQTLSAHYAPITEEVVPPSLTALLAVRTQDSDKSGGEVVSFAAARVKRGLSPTLRRWAPIAGPAIAASLVLAVLQPWRGEPAEGYAQGDLAAALDKQLAATQSVDAPTRILVSFEKQGGGLCRAWRGVKSGGIACREASGWKIEQQFALGDTPGGEFRQVGSETDLLGAAQEMAAGQALDAAGEYAARARGWQR